MGEALLWGFNTYEKMFRCLVSGGSSIYIYIYESAAKVLLMVSS